MYTIRLFERMTDFILAKCTPGHYSETGLAPCAPCPANFYQPLSGQISCLECPSSTRTKGAGSAGREECQNVVCTDNSCLHGGLCVPMGKLRVLHFNKTQAKFIMNIRNSFILLIY